MLSKVSALARALSILLAVVAGFVAIPSLDVGLVLVVLGLIAGLSMAADRIVPTAIAVLVLPAVAAALDHVPTIGAQLGEVAGGIALTAAAAVASAIALRLFDMVRGDLAGLGTKA